MNLKNNPTLKFSKINPFILPRVNIAPYLERGACIRVGLSIGDPSGIGPAIALKALKILEHKANFTVIGNSFVLAKAVKMLNNCSMPAKLINLDNVKTKNFSFGKLNAQNGLASIQYLDKALELLKKGKIDCLVTCPVSKEAVNLSGIRFSGHTEYLGKGTGCRNLLMMLLNDKLKFSLVTRHIGIKDVPRLLTSDILEDSKAHFVLTQKKLQDALPSTVPPLDLICYDAIKDDKLLKSPISTCFKNLDLIISISYTGKTCDF